MKRTVITFLALSLFLSACAAAHRTPVKPGGGVFFSSYKAPLMVDMHNTDIGSNSIHAASKKTYYFHDILLTGINVSWDTADVPEIARKAGITEITCADYEIMNILGVYAEFTVHVYGR